MSKKYKLINKSPISIGVRVGDEVVPLKAASETVLELSEEDLKSLKQVLASTFFEIEIQEVEEKVSEKKEIKAGKIRERKEKGGDNKLESEPAKEKVNDQVKVKDESKVKKKKKK